MQGTILGYDVENQTGTISGNDGKRYKFDKSHWKESFPPQKEMLVDFDPIEGGKAEDVFQVRDKAAETNDTVMGLLSVALTFFLGFIGTFISRLVISKQPIGATLIPTAIHFVITLLIFVPVIGWLVYLAGTIYYIIKNYQLVIHSSVASPNKYA